MKSQTSRRSVAGRSFSLSLFGLLVLWLGLAATVAGRENPTRVATYNVRNYLSMDRLVEGKWRPDYPKPEREKKHIRKAIIAVDPDILALQEIGSPAHLEELRRDLAMEGLAFTGAALLEAHDSERHLAALWKPEVDAAIREHPNLPIKYLGKVDFVKRGMLEIQVADTKGGWSVFVLHLKSKYTTEKSDPLSAKRRALEGRAARDRIIRVYPDLESERFLIAGDFNDSPDSSVLRALTKKGERVLSFPIDCVDTDRERWTHYYRKADTYARIDYILASPGWAELKAASGAIHDPLDFYEGSDHRIVYVDISAN